MKSEIESYLKTTEAFVERLSSQKMDRRGQLVRQHANEFAEKLHKLVAEYAVEEHEADVERKLAALTGDAYTMSAVLDAAGVGGDRDDQRLVSRVMARCGFVPATLRRHGVDVSGFQRVAK